jgi:hypothetical protein
MDVIEHTEDHEKVAFCSTWFYVTGRMLSEDSIRIYWYNRGYSFKQAG